MGFTTGFTGGVTFTLSVAYLSVLGFQRSRQQQCQVLRTNTAVLRALADADPITAARLIEPTAADPVILAEAAAADRPYLYGSSPAGVPTVVLPRSGFVEMLKARWNAQIEDTVRSVQKTDWVSVREDAEALAAHLWARMFSESAAGTAVAGAAAAASDKAGTVAEAATTAAKNIKASAAAAGSKVKAKAESTTVAAAAAVERAADKVEGLSDVEVALRKRYSKADDGAMKKDVGELLEERYKHKN